MKKTSAVMVFVILFLLTALLGMAGQGQGASVIVLKKDGFQLRGELLEVKPDSLVLLLNQRNVGVDMSVNVKDIAEIRIPKKSHTALGIGVGLLAGLVVGLIARPHAESSSQSGFAGVVVAGIVEETAGMGTVLLRSVGGAAVGGIIGAASGTDEVYRVSGMDKNAVETMLRTLSQRAWVKGLQ